METGALFTEDDDIASLLDSLRIHGKGDEKYQNVHVWAINERW